MNPGTMALLLALAAALPGLPRAQTRPSPATRLLTLSGAVPELLERQGPDGLGRSFRRLTVRQGTFIGHPEEQAPSSTYLFTKEVFRVFRLVADVRRTVSSRHASRHPPVALLGERFEGTGVNRPDFRSPVTIRCIPVFPITNPPSSAWCPGLPWTGSTPSPGEALRRLLLPSP